MSSSLVDFSFDGIRKIFFFKFFFGREHMSDSKVFFFDLILDSFSLHVLAR